MAHTKRISSMARRHAAAAGLGVIPAWCPPLPVNVNLPGLRSASHKGPTAQEAADAAIAQRSAGFQSLAALQVAVAEELANDTSSGVDTTTGRPIDTHQPARRAAQAAALAPAPSLDPVIRWASVAATGASNDSAWGPPPTMVPAPYAKRARPLDFGHTPLTRAFATGGGLFRETVPTDPLGGGTSTSAVPGIDDTSATVASLEDANFRAMPPNPASAGVPRASEVRASSGFPGAGPSMPLRKLADAASTEEVLSGTFPADLSGVASLE